MTMLPMVILTTGIPTAITKGTKDAMATTRTTITVQPPLNIPMAINHRLTHSTEMPRVASKPTDHNHKMEADGQWKLADISSSQ